MSLAGFHIVQIVLLSSQFQVTGSTAASVVAAMADNQTSGDRSFIKLVGNPMGTVTFALDFKGPVSIADAA